MPEEVPKESEHSSDAKSPKRIISWWKKIHFSGRVITCSVLFGFGLILIGSLVFVINADDDSPKPGDQNVEIEIPSKAPSNIVGPVVMAIGAFVVITGIVMCLFETQICRKNTGDSSPLISGGRPDLESGAVSPTSQTQKSQKRNKNGASPKKLKGHHAKYHSKNKHKQKTPSPKTPPIQIESPRNYLTSSDEKFLTPPSTMREHSVQVHDNARYSENQSSKSLMKSFSSSGPSWTQSTEFQTPSTSFKDTSVSLNSSIEIGDSRNNLSTSEMVNIGFMTPVTAEEERLKEMASQIKNHKDKLSNKQACEQEEFSSESAIVKHEKKTNDVSVPHTNVEKQSQENEKIMDNNTLTEHHQHILNDEIKERPVGENQSKLDDELIKSTDITLQNEEMLNKNALMEQQQHISNDKIKERPVEENQQKLSTEQINSADIIQQHEKRFNESADIDGKDNDLDSEMQAVEENLQVLPVDNHRGKPDSKMDAEKGISGNRSDECHTTGNADENISQPESDEINDFESSNSSNETVVSQIQVHETSSSNRASCEENFESQSENKSANADIKKSENILLSAKNNITVTEQSQNDKLSLPTHSKDGDKADDVRSELKDLG